MARRPCGPLHRSVCKPCRAASNLSRDKQPFPCTVGDSPDPRQRPFGLGQRPYPPGYGFPVPFGGWPSLLGSSCARCGFGPSFRRSSGLLAGGQTATGLPRSAPDELRRGRAPSLLRGRGVSDRSKARSRSHGPYRRVSHRYGDFRLRSLNEGSLAFALPVFPWPGTSGWLGLPLGFTRLLSHASLPSACAGREPTQTHIGVVATQLTTTHQERLSRRTSLHGIPALFQTINSAHIRRLSTMINATGHSPAATIPD